MRELKPCPFCGTKLAEFPQVMTVKPVRTETYLLAKLQAKKSLEAMRDTMCFVCNAAVWGPEE